MDAIRKTEGPCVVLAGAGTGKTFTIVEKIKHIVDNKIYSPDKIVCITFSNEAANNLSLRIDKILGNSSSVDGVKRPIVRTFHGFSADLLRKYGDRIGISKEFKILDPQQAMVVLHRNLKVHANNCDRYVGTIGTAKDLGLKLENFQGFLSEKLKKFYGVDLEKRMENLNFELQTMHLGSRGSWGKKKWDLIGELKKVKNIIEMKKFVNIWNAYEKLKQKGNYQDYSDLNQNALLLLDKNPDIAREFEYVIVDEFQDTNKIQLDFLIRLAIGGNITVVGDLNQSIYRFRGAYRENLGLFKKAFNVSSGDVFNLDKSYRSSNKILKVSHKLISNNYINKDECFFVENVHGREGEKVGVFEMKDAKEEARKVIELIKEEQEKGTALEEICVMFRAHQYGRIIKRALEQAGISYFSVSKASLMKQKSVKTAYDYMAILSKLKRKEKGGEQAWWDLVYQLDFSQDDLIKIGKTIKDFNRKMGKQREVNVNDKNPIGDNGTSSVGAGKGSDLEVNEINSRVEVKLSNNYINDNNIRSGLVGSRDNVGAGSASDVNKDNHVGYNKNKSVLDNKVSNGSNGCDIISIYLFNNLENLELSQNGKLSSKILIEKLKTLIPFSDKPVSELLQEVYRVSGLLNEQKTKEEREAMLNLNKFFELAKVHEELYDNDLHSFLYYLEIIESLGIEIEAARLEEKGVRMMTSHSTKGLEYRTVILTNMASGRFPIERWVGNSLIPTDLLPEIRGEIRVLSDEEKEDFIRDYEKHHQLLEERRLAYVSFTRAKENLILTFADEYGGKKVSPSCFLSEIDFKREGNPNINFMQDFENKYVEPEVELKTMDSEFAKALGASDSNFDALLEGMAAESEKRGKKEHQRFSPSALLTFENCQKQFEYKYVYNMPEKKSVSWEAMRMGSFVHLVLEKGVSSGFSRVEEFLELAKEMCMDEDWESVELGDAETLIKVFFERNKGKYNAESKTEQYLPLQLAGMDFIGFADRIDFSSNGVEIIDYKTGKTVVAPRDRNWQLGFYALAAQEKFGKVRKVVLDMLKQDKPLEFDIDENGNAVCVSSDRMGGFNIYEVEQELIMAAHKVQEAYKKGFKPCPIEKNCEFCNEYVYGF